MGEKGHGALGLDETQLQGGRGRSWGDLESFWPPAKCRKKRLRIGHRNAKAKSVFLAKIGVRNAFWEVLGRSWLLLGRSGDGLGCSWGGLGRLLVALAALL